MTNIPATQGVLYFIQVYYSYDFNRFYVLRYD